MQQLQVIEIKGIRVLTTRQIANMYGTEPKIINNNFLRNKNKYLQGKHYIPVSGEEMKQLRTSHQFDGELKRISKAYFWTEKGALLHAKSLNTDKAWEVYDYLVDFYFRAKEDGVEKQESESPWFIRKFRGRYIVLERDFITITGIDIRKHKAFYREEYFKGGSEWNGYGWKNNNDEFKKEYGFDYGTDDCLLYFYLRGVRKALRILQNDRTVHMNPGAVEMLTDGLKMITKPETEKIAVQNSKIIEIPERCGNNLPIQINITIGK